MTNIYDASPAAIAAARAAGDTVALIAARTRLSPSTVQRRARAGGFVPKLRTRKDAADPLIERLRNALARKIAIVEARLASGEGITRIDSEREAREMNGLTRMLDRLTEIGGRMRGKSADKKATAGDDETERLGRELAERLERLRRQHG